jgi:hypothetical protein
MKVYWGSFWVDLRAFTAAEQLELYSNNVTIDKPEWVGHAETHRCMPCVEKGIAGNNRLIDETIGRLQNKCSLAVTEYKQR